MKPPCAGSGSCLSVTLLLSALTVSAPSEAPPPEHPLGFHRRPALGHDRRARATRRFRPPSPTAWSSGLPLHERLLHGLDGRRGLPAQPHHDLDRALALAHSRESTGEGTHPRRALAADRPARKPATPRSTAARPATPAPSPTPLSTPTSRPRTATPSPRPGTFRPAIDFVEKHDSTKPFFLYLAPPVPHDPRVAPPRFHALYDPAQITLSANFMPRHPFDNGALKIRDELLAAIPRDPRRDAPAPGRLLRRYHQLRLRARPAPGNPRNPRATPTTPSSSSPATRGWPSAAGTA